MNSSNCHQISVVLSLPIEEQHLDHRTQSLKTDVSTNLAHWGSSCSLLHKMTKRNDCYFIFPIIIDENKIEIYTDITKIKKKRKKNFSCGYTRFETLRK